MNVTRTDDESTVSAAVAARDYAPVEIAEDAFGRKYGLSGSAHHSITRRGTGTDPAMVPGCSILMGKRTSTSRISSVDR